LRRFFASSAAKSLDMGTAIPAFSAGDEQSIWREPLAVRRARVHRCQLASTTTSLWARSERDDATSKPA
jgi:hypothetical protein